MSKKKDKPLNRHHELSFTETDDAVIGKKADSLGVVCDLEFLQSEVDKLVERWKEEVMFL